MKQLGEPLSDEQLSDMMREADSNGDGKIDFKAREMVHVLFFFFFFLIVFLV